MNAEQMLERTLKSLRFIASHNDSMEGDRDATEEDFGLDYDEVIEMAYDNMIQSARNALEDIGVSRKA